MSHSELKRVAHTLSVVVCTYDRYNLLDGAIESLLRQTAENFEIVIVDNSPDHERAQKHGEKYAGNKSVTYIVEPKPGLSRARNIGVARSTGSVVAFLDDDAVASPGWVSEIISTFDTFPGNVGVVGGAAVPRWTAPPPEWLTPKLRSYLSIVDWGRETRELRPGEWLAGCNISFKRTLLEQVGGFSETLGRSGVAALLSNEETQVVDLIKGVGGLVVYNPSVSVEHTIDVGRLDELWFYRRAAWQAVSDFLSDSDSARKHARKVADRVSGFFDERRTPSGTQDRTAAIYNLVLSCLAGEGIFGENRGGRSGSRIVKNLRSIPSKTIKKIKSALTSFSR